MNSEHIQWPTNGKNTLSTLELLTKRHDPLILIISDPQNRFERAIKVPHHDIALVALKNKLRANQRLFLRGNSASV